MKKFKKKLEKIMKTRKNDEKILKNGEKSV